MGIIANVKVPTCVVVGCGQPATYRKRRKNGNYDFRSVCTKHHKTKLKVTKGMRCENDDGHLGFPCTATIIDPVQLHIDHVDGNRHNNNTENHRVYCANCHAVKTIRNGDHKNRYDQEVPTTFNNIFEEI